MLAFTGSGCRILGVQTALGTDLLVGLLDRLLLFLLLGGSKLTVRKLVMHPVSASLSRILLAPRAGITAVF
jgi:hypothetical protein